MNPARRPWVGFGALTLLIALAGCSSSNLPDEPNERIAAAKAASQSAEDTVAAFVPRDEVERRHQIPTGNLLPCSSGEQWSGNTTMHLVRRYDADRLVDTVARKAARAGLTVERDVSRSGTPRLRLTDDGVSRCSSGSGTRAQSSTSTRSRCASHCRPASRQTRRTDGAHEGSTEAER